MASYRRFRAIGGQAATLHLLWDSCDSVWGPLWLATTSLPIYTQTILKYTLDTWPGHYCGPLGGTCVFECTSIWLLISVFRPPTACNCSPISRQSAPVVRQRSSSAWPSGVSDPWGRTVWPRPATPQATKILARCLTRLSTGQPRLYGDFSVTCLTCRYLMYLGWLMGLEPTTTGITILGSTIELQPPLFSETHTE